MLRPFLRAWSRVVIVAAVAATAGERTGRPAIAGRLAFEQTGDREQVFGVGVYQSSQNWGFDRTANAWAVTACTP